ncbi:serine/threonine-protein kinase RsbW [Streptomyces sp. V4I8]|uniref:ATP-binding protein n=1 Tax=Streptomyces sp. V4I8 TaxID=3156469 RepID=UPI003518E9E5
MRLAKVLTVLLASGSAHRTFRSRRNGGLMTPCCAAALTSSDQCGLRRHPADQSASIILRAEPRSVSAAREFVKDVLQGWEVASGGDVLATARLLVSELFTNAVIHGDSSAVQLALAVRGSVLRIEVVDNGGSPQEFHEVDAAPTDEHGRGLLLVRELAERWGQFTERTGTRVWFDLALTS